MSRFHINPDTKEIGRCTAEKQGCRYGDSTPHFENLEDAYAMSEKLLQEEHGTFNKISEKEDYDPFAPQPEEFSESISKGHRIWQAPDEYFEEGDYINYNGEIQKVDEIQTSFNYDRGDYDYTIITNKGKIELSDYEWKESDDLDISIVRDPLNSDDLSTIPPGRTGIRFSDYMKPGDLIMYDGSSYKVKDFEYNRALLSYELDTDRGKLYISDSDWYHDSCVKIVK